MRILFTLKSISHKASLPVNYNYFLTGLIYSILSNSSKDFSSFLHNKGFRLGESKKGFKLFTYSMLMSKDVKVRGDKILFGKGNIQWQISSPVSDFVQHLITGVFTEGQEINVGSVGKEVTFLIDQIETLPNPEFKPTMHFTCLSPITVSKIKSSNRFDSSNGFNRLNDSNSWNGWNCHYLRPWEEGFSEAIKNNLMKKYELITGKTLENSDFRITIDSKYMNRKSGKITKNINFKGTNIIGFMSPFEVMGNPELIEIGYEAGFGEKGSMGFGMVKINKIVTDRFSNSSSFNSSNGCNSSF